MRCPRQALGDCRDILSNLASNNACVKARDKIMKLCFRGGDRRHQIARAEARQGIINCIIQAQTNSCPGF